MTATNEFITRRLNAIKSQRKSGELEDLALVIGEQDYNDFFVWLQIMKFDRWEKSDFRA